MTFSCNLCIEAEGPRVDLTKTYLKGEFCQNLIMW